MKPIDATDITYDAAIATGKPVLVDFWAPWCGPCRKVAPIVDAIAAEHEEYTVVKVDIDVAQATALKYQIMSVPTLIVLDTDGQIVERFSGPKPKAALVQALGKVG